MSDRLGFCSACASGDHGRCHGQCGCRCGGREGFAPDTPMPTRSKTKALRDENTALREKGMALAKAAHKLAAEGSDAPAEIWHRCSDAASAFEAAASTQPVPGNSGGVEEGR